MGELRLNWESKKFHYFANIFYQVSIESLFWSRFLRLLLVTVITFSKFLNDFFFFLNTCPVFRPSDVLIFYLHFKLDVSSWHLYLCMACSAFYFVASLTLVTRFFKKSIVLVVMTHAGSCHSDRNGRLFFFYSCISEHENKTSGNIIKLLVPSLPVQHL